MKLNFIKNLIPKSLKLDSIVDSVTTNAKERKIAKLIVRVVQIIAVCYLLTKGLISEENAIGILGE